MKKIKLVHVVAGINFGGVESFLYSYFTNMNLSNYDIVMISHDTPNEENKKMFEKLGIRIYKVTPKRKNLFKNLKGLYNILKKEKPDIIHTHLTLSNYAPLMIAKILGVKKRISHSHIYLENKNILENIYSKMTCMFANEYLACSYDAGVYLYNKHKFKIIKNAFDTNKFKYNEDIRNKIRNELNINNKFVIGHIGRFFEQKNHKKLIDIFNEFVKLKNNSVLLLIGSGELEGEIREQVEKENLIDKVIFLGNIKNIENYYQAMDFFLFPSLYEGLGIVLIEAQISGLPILASNKVPKEAKITDLVEFIDLDVDSKRWALKIKKNSRRSYLNEAKNSGYEITNEVKKIEEIYNS